MKINIRHNSPKIADALARAPEQVLPEIDKALLTGANLVARQARADAPMGTNSHLTNSIDVVSTPLRKTIAAGAAYGRYVERGTGMGGRPTMRDMLKWIQAKRISPRDPDMTPQQLAYIIRRKIVTGGIRHQPFFYPAYEKQRSALTQLLESAVDRGLAKVGG